MLKRLRAWLSEEQPAHTPFTRQDPRCRRREIQQRVEAQRLRRAGITLRARLSCGWAHDEKAFRFARSDR